ncbi:diacylglycerol/lipid kinase family protein [Bacillus sp. V33-4]|uniref:diacylglycerol/lipid kinase family protein n=1 Tax=Bacillus sp. V33-4 TaxID=2054169 RepID=UPI000C7950F8|nr:YegS/Rv2252/BmrU family lipid kinase [Bacillus sp. V33-4]PLR87222.1 lipid kinase [Bacillus sp. V33-4]
MGKIDKAMLVYNAHAGQQGVQSNLEACLPILAAEIEQLTVMKSSEQGHLAEICKNYGAEQDVLFILGGDGTVHECINGLAELQKKPAIAVLPGGTCNDISRMMEIPQNIRTAAEALLTGIARPFDAIKADDHYLINFWGIGLVTKTSNNINEAEKERLGKISYYLSAIRTINKMEPFRYTITCDGETSAGEAIMILVANGQFIGTNRLPFCNISFDDGLAEIIIVKNASLTLLKELFTLDLTQINEETGREFQLSRGSKIKIETEKRMEADMDGEVYLQTPCELTVLKHYFRFIKPA